MNRTTLILCTIAFILGGLLLIFRGLQNKSNFQQFDATVKDVVISHFESQKTGLRYSLDLTFIERDDVYGVYLGTKEQADQNGLIRKIEIGKMYKFYIDPTVMTSGMHNLGINRIEFNGTTIFKENYKVNYIGGGLLLIFGILGFLTLLYAGRLKNNGL